MSNFELRIMIIDENTSIHYDLINILTMTHEAQLLSELDNESLQEIKGSYQNTIKQKYNFPEFIIETASEAQEGFNKIQSDFNQGLYYAIVFINFSHAFGVEEIKAIKRIWSIDPEIQMIISTNPSEFSWDQTIEILGNNDNYLIFEKPLDTIAVRQLVGALTKKWMLTKESKQQIHILHQTLEDQTNSLQHSIALLRSTIESSNDGILITDLNKQLIDYNNKFISMWSIPDSIIKSKNINLIFEHMNNQLIHTIKNVKNFKNIEREINGSSKQILTLNNGSIIECYSQPHRLNNKTIGQIWSYHDVTKRANLEQKLEFQASHDILTGLPNRLIIIDRLKNAIERAIRSNKDLAVLFIDLDRFKLINDSLNHTTGDALLRLIAIRLSAIVRKEDTLARLGGDEFIMIIPDLEQDEHSVNIALKILKSFKEPFLVSRHKIKISPSIGISLFPSDGKNADDLLKNADLAMYQAKEQGGNQFQFYTEELNERTIQRFKLEAELNQALIHKQFFLVYQPLFDINSKKLLSIEALIRWQHPEKGCLSPIDFIKVAEESGLIIPIGEWVIREVCSQIKSWNKKKIPIQTIAINIATQQLKQINFAIFMKNIIKEYKIQPQCLEFEITENIVMTHLDVIQMINELTKLGIKIVLDDFGTGKSSLNYLNHIHIDRLKIDPSFIKNIAHSRSDEVFIEAIIAMARRFNFKVLAEGVETQNQITYLKKHHCDQVQGFLLSEPLISSSIENFLKEFASKNNPEFGS